VTSRPGPAGLGMVVLALLALAPGASCGESTAAAAPPRAGAGVVASINDGDSLRLRDGRRIRLVQIDAPEDPAECFGRAATRVLVRLAPRGTAVRLVADPALDERDAHGRLLRYVFAGGRNVNLALVRAGAAAPFFFRGARGRYAGALLEEAREARASGRGLWGACPGTRLAPGRGIDTGSP
jgi:micrococcal nuclease